MFTLIAIFCVNHMDLNAASVMFPDLIQLFTGKLWAPSSPVSLSCTEPVTVKRACMVHDDLILIHGTWKHSRVTSWVPTPQGCPYGTVTHER